MAKSIVQVNTDSALDLSKEIESITNRIDSFLNFLKSTDRQYHLNNLDKDRKIIRKALADNLSLRRENNETIYNQEQPSYPKETPKKKPKSPEPLSLGSLLLGGAAASAFGNSAVSKETSMIPLTQPAPPPPIFLSDVSLGLDYKGREIKLSEDASRAFARMRDAAAEEGLDISKGITSSTRSVEDNERVGGAINSGHLSGNAFDINWYSPEGQWILENSEKYGFKFNDYSDTSTHFDFIGGEVTPDQLQSSISEPQISPIFVVSQPEETEEVMNGDYMNLTAQTPLNNNVDDVSLEQIIFSLV